MKKMMRTALMATMAFALLLLPACGGGSDDGAQAPAVEEESSAGTAAGEEVSTEEIKQVADLVLNDLNEVVEFLKDKV